MSDDQAAIAVLQEKVRALEVEQAENKEIFKRIDAKLEKVIPSWAFTLVTSITTGLVVYVLTKL